MSESLRRGACPSLQAPMLTGDGLLARLKPADSAISARQLSAIARAAGLHGNGRMEITSRGSLQIRGLTEASAPRFAREVAALGLDLPGGVPVETAPLAGLDPGEITDPRPMVAAIRAAIAGRGLAARLGPKVSVVVDGGGHSMLAAVPADLRLVAMAVGQWRFSIAGDVTTAASLATGEACDAVLHQLEAIANLGIAARGRDLLAAPAQTEEPGTRALTVGAPLRLRDGGYAARVALAAGRAEVAPLIAFAEDLLQAGITRLRLSPDHGLFLLGSDMEAALAIAARHGLVTAEADGRHAVIACAGAPGCASGHYDTKALAADITREAPHLLPALGRLHLSGCDKGCAATGGVTVTVTGHREGCRIAGTDPASITALRDYLARRGFPTMHDQQAT